MGFLRHNKIFRRIASAAMALTLVLTGITVTPETAKAQTGPVATPVTSISYDVTISGIDDETELTWTSVAPPWNESTASIPLKEDGNYTFTVTYDSPSGIYNMGYFNTDVNKSLTISFQKMTVNGTYEIALDNVLKPGLGDKYNALANVWNGFTCDTVLYGDENGDSAYFAYSSTDSLIYFYTIGELSENTSDGTVATKIDSIEYELSVSGVADETSLTWTSQDGGWTNHAVSLPLKKGNGDYVLDAEYDSITGFKNMGFFATSDNEDLTITINKMIVNETYTIDLDITLTPGTTDDNGNKSNNALKNIWSGVSDGEPIYTNGTAYFAYDKTNDLIVFRAPEAEPIVSNQSSIPVETQIDTIEYIGTVDGADGAGSFGWTVITTANWWTQKSTTVNYTGNGALSFTVDFSKIQGEYKGLGAIDWVDNSGVTFTLEKIIINDYYTLTFSSPLVCKESWGNGMPRSWEISQDCLIAEDEFSLASVRGVYSDYYDSKGELQNSSVIKFYAPSVSSYYVLSMGDGWNLGNSFDGVNTDTAEADKGETAWGNPAVTEALIDAVCEKGYDSIRMPMTLERRYSEVDGKYVIDEDWLARYKEVVDYAVSKGLYVMINIHHDSWIWLANWDGDEESEEYVKFTQLWAQLAEYFKDEPYLVSFETINEPYFDESVTALSQQKRLTALNLAAYNVIRNSGGNNEKRIIVMPTLSCSSEKSEALYKTIAGLDDPYVTATVHYYSEWVYSANLGKTGFDEELWLSNGSSYTPRVSVDTVFSGLYDTFTANGIGVIIGEYGLLGYDAGEQTNQAGEELKYYDYVNYVAKQKGLCLMFWDNGSGIDRTSSDYSWKKEKVGAALEAALNGERSSYATGLDTIYLSEATAEDISIALTLNGNTFTGVSDANGALSEDDYSYNEETATLTLSADYVNAAYAALGDGYGTFADLTLTFSAGAAWHEYLVKYGTPEFTGVTVNYKTADDGTVSENGVAIAADFKGADVRRVTAYQNGNRVGANSSWWQWLQMDGSFSVTDKSLILLKAFFDDKTVTAGDLTLSVEMYDGQIAAVELVIAEDGSVSLKSDDSSNDPASGNGDTDNTPAGSDNNTGNQTSGNGSTGTTPAGSDNNTGNQTSGNGSTESTPAVDESIDLSAGSTTQTTAASKTKGAAKKGTIFTDKSQKAKYKVTSKVTAATHTVTYIGTTSTSKKTIVIPATVKFNGVTYKVTAIAASAFKNNKKITSVTIGKNVSTIGKNAFYGCKNLKTVKFASGSKLTKIGANAFYKCTTLKKVTIPSKVTTIDAKAFYGCTKLAKISFSSKSSLKTVKNNAFKKCTSLKTLSLPKAAKLKTK